MRTRLAAVVIVLALTAHAVAGQERQTRITKVSSSNLRLAAGGRAALTVEGTDLSNVTAVRLLRNGQVVQGVEGAVTRTRTGELAIQLSAGSSVPAGTYQMELLSAGRRILVPVQVDVTVSSIRQSRVAGEVTIPSPAVTGATPATVSIEAGADPTTVTVTGTLLRDLRAAYVERNGVRVSAVRAELVASTAADRREVRLSAQVGAPVGQPLDLVLEAPPPTRIGNAVKVTTPVKVTVTQPALRLKGDAPLREPVEQLLGGAMTQFNSCGATAAIRTFTVAMPNLGYSARGSVPRLEQSLDAATRVQFALGHSLKPNDTFNPATLVTLANSGHPSPIPHGISAVRLCMLPLPPPTWDVRLAPNSASGLDVVVTATYPVAAFRGRGMPSAPGGIPDGLNVGIMWGHDITDKEIPDLVYTQPRLVIRFPLNVQNGTLVQGTADAQFSGTPKWSGTFYGTSEIRARMERHARDRMQQMADEIEKAFNASQAKTAIQNAIMSSLRNQGVGQLVGFAVENGTWKITYTRQ